MDMNGWSLAAILLQSYRLGGDPWDFCVCTSSGFGMVATRLLA